jgi:hypothetical protein
MDQNISKLGYRYIWLIAAVYEAKSADVHPGNTSDLWPFALENEFCT